MLSGNGKEPVKMNLEKYLKPTEYIESDHPDIIAFVQTYTNNDDNAITKAVKLFYAVRDQIHYDPYTFNLNPESLKASHAVKQEKSYCIPKAVLMTAVSRAANIPARMGFADLINHSMSGELKEILNTNRLVWHGYTELFLNDQWIKTTPAFNVKLCKRMNVPPVEFNGTDHAKFPSTDNAGNKHMEYCHYHGIFDDPPVDRIFTTMKAQYPILNSL